MEIELFKLGKNNLVARNYIDKDLDANYVIKVTLTGKLRDSMNISNPILYVDLSSNIVGTNYNENDFKEDFFNFDYARIGELKRCYFIKDMTLIANNILQITFHIDVLCFTDFIKSQLGFVTRNRADYDPLLPDERRIISNKMEVTEYEPEPIDGSLVNTTFETFFNSPTLPKNDKVNIIINAYGLGAIPATSSPYSSTNYKETKIPSLPTKIQYSFNPCVSMTYATNARNMDTVLDFLYNHSTEESYCGGIFVFPFAIQNDELYHDPQTQELVESSIFVGGSNTNGNGLVCLNKTSNELIVADFLVDNPSNKFELLEPYSKYEIYLPYYGWTELPYNTIYGKRIIVYYIVNYCDGTAIVNVLNKTDNIILFSSSCQLGVQIGTSRTNAQQVEDKNRQNNNNLILSLLTSAIAVGGGLLTGNPITAGMGIVGGALNVGKALTNYNEINLTNYHNAMIALNGGISPLFMYQKVKIRVTTRKVLISLSDIVSTYGAPLNQFRLLSQVRGYTEVSEIPNIYYDPNDDVTPTDNEINELLNVLRNGVVF